VVIKKITFIRAECLETADLSCICRFIQALSVWKSGFWGRNMTSTTTPAEGLRAKSGHKLLAGGAIVLTLVLAGVVLFSHRGLYQIYRFGQDRVRLEQENARLAEDNARLGRTIDRLQHDPEMIQDVIRRELNFVKKNEIIFQLPPGSQSKPSASSPPSGAVRPGGPQTKAEASPGYGKLAWSWESVQGAPHPSSKTAR
jgi:cell division protein FtsB